MAHGSLTWAHIAANPLVWHPNPSKRHEAPLDAGPRQAKRLSLRRDFGQAGQTTMRARLARADHRQAGPVQRCQHPSKLGLKSNVAA